MANCDISAGLWNSKYLGLIFNQKHWWNCCNSAAQNNIVISIKCPYFEILFWSEFLKALSPLVVIIVCGCFGDIALLICIWAACDFDTFGWTLEQLHLLSSNLFRAFYSFQWLGKLMSWQLCSKQSERMARMKSLGQYVSYSPLSTILIINTTTITFLIISTGHLGTSWEPQVGH